MNLTPTIFNAQATATDNLCRVDIKYYTLTLLLSMRVNEYGICQISIPEFVKTYNVPTLGVRTIRMMLKNLQRWGYLLTIEYTGESNGYWYLAGLTDAQIDSFAVKFWGARDGRVMAAAAHEVRRLAVDPSAEQSYGATSATIELAQDTKSDTPANSDTLADMFARVHNLTPLQKSPILGVPLQTCLQGSPCIYIHDHDHDPESESGQYDTEQKNADAFFAQSANDTTPTAQSALGLPDSFDAPHADAQPVAAAALTPRPVARRNPHKTRTSRTAAPAIDQHRAPLASSERALPESALPSSTTPAAQLSLMPSDGSLGSEPKRSRSSKRQTAEPSEETAWLKAMNHVAAEMGYVLNKAKIRDVLRELRELEATQDEIVAATREMLNQHGQYSKSMYVWPTNIPATVNALRHKNRAEKAVDARNRAPVVVDMRDSDWGFLARLAEGKRGDEE